MRVPLVRGAAAPPLAAPARRDLVAWSREILGRDWLTAWLFAGPMLALLVGLIAWPFLQGVWMSFNLVIGGQWRGFVGLQNYIDTITDPYFQRSFWITVQFTASAVALKFVFGLVAALILHNITRGRTILTALILLPWIVPEVVTALAWRFLYDPVFGGLNLTLQTLYQLTGGLLGVSKGIPWTGDPKLALWSMVAVNLWKGIPFFTVLALAGLKSIDRELYDAAAVDGANAWQRFLHVTLPGLRYVIIVETLLSTIWTFNTFGLVFLITGGGPGGATRLYGILAYEKIGGLRYSSGVATALVTAPILALAIIVLGRYMRAGQRGDFGDEGILYRGVMLLLWPVRQLVRLLVAAFWAVDYVVEIAFEKLARLSDMLFTRGDPRRKKLVGSIGSKLLIYVPLAVILLFVLFPFYWIFITAFKSTLQFQQKQSIFWPAPWTLDNFVTLFTKTEFVLWYKNTIQVALVSMLISVIVSSLGAYALVRLRWRGAGFISTAILLTYLMPGIMLVVPLYQIFVALRVINTPMSLMIAYPTFLMPFACWLLMGYYRSIPEELEESALIDGCNRFQAFTRIVLPLTMPALVAVAMFAVTQAWNEFLFAFIFITSNAATTLPVGLGKMVIGDVFPWGQLMAASLLMAIPVVTFYGLAQRFMVEGLTAGSVKGGG
jgi:multiple sugar transport system permease protein